MSALEKTKKKTISFLHWSQRYTKTDMVYLTKGSFWVGLGYCIQIVSGLIVMIALANLLPKESLGTYQFILATASILSAFTLSGMGIALTRAVAQGNDSMLRTGFRTKMLWNIGIAVAAGVLATYYFINGNNELALGFLIVGAFAPLLEGFNLYEPFLTGKEHFKQSVLLGAWRKPLPVIALIVTAFLSQNPIVLVLIYFLSHTISTGSVFLLVMRKYQIPRMTKKDGDSITYSKHLSVMRFLSITATNADKLLLFHFLGPVQVAIFTIAQLPVRYTRNALHQLRSLVMPKLAKRDFITLSQSMPQKVYLFILIAIVITIVYIIVTPFLFPLLFPEYPESVLLTQVLALSVLFLPHSMYTHALTAHEKTKQLYIVNLVTPTTRITLLITLIPLYEIWGAVYAILISGFFGAFGAHIAFRYFSTGNIESTLPIKNDKR